MSLPEVIWRIRGVVRDSADRWTVGTREVPLSFDRVMNGEGIAGLMRSAAFGDFFGTLGDGDDVPAEIKQRWRSDAVSRADAVADHLLSFFDLEHQHLGASIDWNYEHKARKSTPMVFSGDIDYRDYSVTGDCKFVWEPNRHHQLVLLGRAYRWTGDERYAVAAVEQLESWMDQCPFGRGMNWRSPLELSIRLINWVWTLELIRGSKALSNAFVERIASVIYRHLWDVTRKFSRYSSANNHLIGEAAGVYIGSTYFRGLKNARRWRGRSREILQAEMFAQTYEDGGNREQALGYHLFVLPFLLLPAIVGRHDDDDFGQAYWGRLEKMFEFVSAFIDGDSVSPMFGDSDDGYVLDLGMNLGDPRSLMAIGAVLFDRNDFKALAGDFPESAYWLLGGSGMGRFDSLDVADVSSTRRSCALSDSGYYILSSDTGDGASPIRVVFDCGELGFKSIAAHGHADALSFTLRAGGHDILVDPGTYDYFTYPCWRNYFRSTRAHNTIGLDGTDQSEMLGSFLWGRKANARCLRWEPTDAGGRVVGEHDGYSRLNDPVTHRRTVSLDAPAGVVEVVDELVCDGRHEVALALHFAEHCRVTPSGKNRFDVDYGGGRATIALDGLLSVELFRGSEDPICGWVSRGYHRRNPAITLVGRCTCNGGLKLDTRVVIEAVREVEDVAGMRPVETGVAR